MLNTYFCTIRRFFLFAMFICGVLLSSCDKDDDGMIPEIPPTVTEPEEKEDITTLGDGPVDFSQFFDIYGHVASPDLTSDWRHYNVHDPSVLDARNYPSDPGEFFYCYNTDVAFGHSIRPGLQIRRSKNLVEWEFVGWVFFDLPAGGSSYITQNGGTPNNGLWAPYAMQVGDEYRVYYSLASDVGRLSCIGLGTSDDPRGPFRETGIVVRSVGDNQPHTNAIDPSIVIDKSGRHWMFYGSSWDGIYLLELDPERGLAKTPGDIGTRIAHRGFTGGIINGNIEGAEIIYNETFDKYYLFIAYDWLETKYNVRVGRSDQPNGPYFDINGQDMNEFSDDLPMILAPYRFEGHSGWQGVSHPAVFARDGEFFLAHQGRPGQNPFYMVLHVRQLHWTQEGWPLVSPQRYATEEETAVERDEIPGDWEQIVFAYHVVPGFAETQTVPDFQRSIAITIDENGTVNGNPDSSWNTMRPG